MSNRAEQTEQACKRCPEPAMWYVAYHPVIGCARHTITPLPHEPERIRQRLEALLAVILQLHIPLPRFCLCS